MAVAPSKGLSWSIGCIAVQVSRKSGELLRSRLSGTSVIVVTNDEKIMPRFRRMYEVRDGVVIDPQSKPG